jgi:hypothetical protein
MPRGIGDAIQSLQGLYLLMDHKNSKETGDVKVAAPATMLTFFMSCDVTVTKWIDVDDPIQIETAVKEVDSIIDCSGQLLTGVDLLRWILEGVAFTIWSHTAFCEYGAYLGNFNFTQASLNTSGFRVVERLPAPYIEPFNGPSEPASRISTRLVSYFFHRSTQKGEHVQSYHSNFRLAQEKPDSKNTICICPAGSSEEKQYPLDHWILLAKQLVSARYEVKIILGPNERHFEQQFKHLTGCQLAIPTDVYDLAAEFATCRLVITNDCGPMHVAAVLDVFLLAIFGPTNPNVWFTYNKPHQQVMKAKCTDWRTVGILETSIVQWPEVEEVYFQALAILCRG